LLQLGIYLAEIGDARGHKRIFRELVVYIQQHATQIKNYVPDTGYH
jgi:hypothetical protein